MPYTSQTSDFWGWYQRHNNRLVWRNLYDAGIDTFASGPSSNQQAFLALDNILPAMSGGFNTRWGIQSYGSATSSAVSTNLVRTFLYNTPQDQSDPSNTANTNLWIGTDNQHFLTTTDSGTAFSGYKPTDFAHSGVVGAVTSRAWFYYGNGIDAPRKVNPSYTTSNTDSLMGIAIPCAFPGSMQYQNYPAALIPAGPTTTGQSGGLLTQVYPGSGYSVGTFLCTGGTGSGLTITVTNATAIGYLISSGIVSWVVASWGIGYSVGDIVTVNSGGVNATFKIVTLPSMSSSIGGSGLGYVASSSFSVSCSDSRGGSGSGASVKCFTNAVGAITSAQVTIPGAGYTQAFVSIPAPPSGGVQGYVTVYTDTNSNSATYGQVMSADLAGPMSFIAGRQWTVALMNSTTGHVSDVFITNIPLGPVSGLNLANLLSAQADLPASLAAVGKVPIYLGSENQTAGYTQMTLPLSVPTNGLDAQVDTVLLLATSDGGSTGNLYQVGTYPLSSFTASGSFLVKTVYDALPDSYNVSANTYGAGDTLLEADLWAYTDPYGNSFGILLNTPPTATGYLYPTLHQGRIFATDGKTVFYSKSLDEVTTTTGLITCKWEECWPGDYQLPIALNNETIIGLKSDGSALHVGTNKSIFTIYGSDPSSFSVPSTAFAQTGILSNDCWEVVYAEGQPSGYVWLTQDYKVIHSDFSTYKDIGTAIYPSLLGQLVGVNNQNLKIHSLTQGPYNFVILSLIRTVSSRQYMDLYIWETRLQKWYHWTAPVSEQSTGFSTPSTFVYQIPGYSSSSLTPGSKFLFYWRTGTGSPNTFATRYFNPTAITDSSINGASPAISWLVRTSWQDGGDSTAVKVIDEVELTSDWAPLSVSLYGATAQSQFDSGGTLLKSGSSVTAPLAALGVNKFYCAGSATAHKYFSVAFSPGSGPATSTAALSSFSVELYPMTRI